MPLSLCSYVQELEARLLYMEQLFKQHAPDVEVLVPFTSATRPAQAPTTKEDDLDVLSHVKHEDESTLTDHFGQMALDAEGHLRWIGGSSTMTLIETFRNETANDEDFGATPSSDQSDGPNMLYFPTGLGFGKLRALPSAEEVEYPERDLADKLVQAYFERFHFLLPVLDKPSFLVRYKHLMDNNGTGEQVGFIAVVFAVFACAARFLDDSRIKSAHYMDPRGTAMIFYERAMMLYIIDHTSTQFAHVQCFALLSAFLASLNRLPQAWLLVGQAVRTAQDLGLHRSPKPLKLSKVDKETRRKVWWCVYGLDRCLAVQLGRPLGIDDNDIDVDMPVPYDDVDLPAYFEGKLGDKKEPTLMQGFVALTALYKIAGKVLRHVYSTDKLKGNIASDKAAELHKVVDKLDQQLTLWVDQLHPTLRQSPDTPQMVSMSAVLCSSYYAVLITLHRNFLPTRKNMMHYVGSSSVPKAVCASRSCIFLATSMNPAIPPSHHLAVFVQSLFSSAIIILLVVMHATDKNAAEIAMSEVGNCVHALESLETTWPGASKCKELLIELTQVTKANLARIGKPKSSRHSSRGSVQLSNPASQESSPKPATSQATVSNGTKTPLQAYSLNGSSTGTPSPPMTFLSPIKPRAETVGGRPLTLRDPKQPELGAQGGRLTNPEFGGSDLQDQRFNPRLAQEAYTTSTWRNTSPPVATYLNDPRIYGPQADYAVPFSPTDPVQGIPANAIYGGSSIYTSTWNMGDAQPTSLDASDYPSLSGMDFIQTFAPTGQMQGEALWENMPEVFSAEPRMFGVLDELQDGHL